MYDLLKAKANGMRDDLIRFARQLVQTRSPSLHEGELADLVRCELENLLYDEVHRDDDGNVIGIMRGHEAMPTILLNCHMDTIHLDETRGSWSLSPFAGIIRKGLLYGLGAADCKGGLAAQIYAGGLLKRSLLPLKGTLVVAATVAEENGVSIGVRTLMEKTLPELGLSPEAAILGEPTSLGLYYGHDGWTEIKIKIAGTDLFHVKDTSEAIYKYIHEKAFIGGDEYLRIRHPSFTQHNGIQRGAIRLERRLEESEKVASVVASLQHSSRTLAQQNGGTEVDVVVCQEEQTLYTGRITNVQHFSHAWAINPFHPLVERSRQALRAAGICSVPDKWKLGRLGMGTAGGALVGQFGVPTICFGPGKESAVYGADEYVDIDSIFQTVYGTAVIVHAMIGVPVYGWISDEI